MIHSMTRSETATIETIKKIVKTIIVFTVAASILMMSPLYYSDWAGAFRASALNWLDPYYRQDFVFNPPWIFPLLYGFALFPTKTGGSLLMGVAIASFYWYLNDVIKTVILIGSIPAMAMIALGQLDFLLLIGLMLPPWLGLPFMVLKPQATLLCIPKRLNRRSIMSLTVVMLISVMIWGFWWVTVINQQPNPKLNMSMLPYSLPLAGLILGYCYRRQSYPDSLLCAASLCVAPYFMIQSLTPLLAVILKKTDSWLICGLISTASWAYALPILLQ